MNKNSFIDAFKANLNKKEDIRFTKKDADFISNAFLDTITEALVSDGKISLVGFGSFEVRQRAAKQVKCLNTDKLIDVPSQKAVAFKAGKNLKAIVRNL